MGLDDKTLGFEPPPFIGFDGRWEGVGLSSGRDG
jgi:hypothetical protein